MALAGQQPALGAVQVQQLSVSHVGMLRMPSLKHPCVVNSLQLSCDTDKASPQSGGLGMRLLIRVSSLVWAASVHNKEKGVSNQHSTK